MKTPPKPVTLDTLPWVDRSKLENIREHLLMGYVVVVLREAKAGGKRGNNSEWQGVALHSARNRTLIENVYKNEPDTVIGTYSFFSATPSVPIAEIMQRIIDDLIDGHVDLRAARKKSPPRTNHKD